MSRLLVILLITLSSSMSLHAAVEVIVQGTVKQFSAVDRDLDMKGTVETARLKCEAESFDLKHSCVRSKDICLGESNKNCYQVMVVFDAVVEFNSRGSSTHRAKRAALTECFEMGAVDCKAITVR